MRNTLYLLLAVVSVIVVCAVTADDTQAPTVAEATPEVKTPTVVDDKADVQEKEKPERDDDEDEIDDSHAPKSSYAHNRFVSYNAPDNDPPRSRSRWSGPSSMSSPALSSGLPFTIGDFADEYDWPSPSYGSAFPTPSGSHSYNMHGMSNNVPSYGMHGMSSNGPTCQPLIDPQYPIFSDTCGAVPQARYALPNALGQRDKWQVAQLLNVLMSASTEPSCTRSLRLLLCPLLFPSCSARHQSPPVLPCQSFCRAVKSRCAIPVLESLPCEALPYSSDLCPTTQPYGPQPHSRAFPTSMPSLPMAGGHQSARQFPTLQSLLSSPAALQAALSAQSFQSGMNPHSLQPGMNPHSLQPGMNPHSFQPGMNPHSFQPGMNPQSFQAAMSAQAYQPPLPAQAYQIASPFFPQAAAPVPAPAPAPVPVMTTPAPTTPAPTVAPVNVYSAAQYPKDTVSSMPGDFGPRTYGNDYRQNARYSPYLRSSNEVRPATDLRSPTETRQPVAARPATEFQPAPAARPPVASSMVKA